jgi:UDP-glucose 4-epimerase
MAVYLVTGGCGFIGSHLCAALVKRGDTVRVVDNLSTGSRSRLPPGAAFIEGDIADAKLVSSAVAGVDGCFHLAAVASVEICNREWIASHRTNLTGAITVFDAARRASVPVIYASSAAVYGDCSNLPLNEHAETRPLSPYGADKIGCELHARAASTVFGLASVGLRFFNVYGPGQDPHSPYSGVISIFCERLRRIEPIEIFGDGTQTRDFVFVTDVVAALLRAMDARLSGARVFNVCTGHATSLLELARTITSLCGMTPQIRFQPQRPGDIKHSYGDPAAVRHILGLDAPTELRAGLAVTLASLGETAASAPVGREPGSRRSPVVLAGDRPVAPQQDGKIE